MTTTERRLAITHTPWDVRSDPVEVGTFAVRGQFEYEPGEFGSVWIARECSEQHAELIADAGTTANACHLTPSELLEKLREAKELIRMATASDSFARMSHMAMSWVKAAEETLNLPK